MFRRLLVLATLALNLPGFAFAQTPAPKAVTLHDLLVDAVNANLELRSKRIDPEIQMARLKAAQGNFDPTWITAYTASYTERPKTAATVSIFSDPNDKTYTENVEHIEIGIAGKLSTGTQYQLSHSTEASRNSYNRSAKGFVPEFVSSSTFTLVQPLLRDFGFGANLAEIRLQRSAKTASLYDLQSTVLRVLRDVTTAYFEMAFAQENIRVKEQAVALAANLVRENQRRVDEGRMAAIDVTQAQSRLSEAREELILAQNFLAQRRNTLRELTRDNFDANETEFVVDPAFIQRAVPALNRDRNLVALFESNPSYLASVEIAKSEDIRIAYAKNQRWPRVDLKGSIGYNGLRDNFTESYQDYSHRDDPSWSAGVVVNVPIFNRTAKGRLAEAKSRKVQALLNLKRTEVLLLSAFDNAHREIATAAERIKLVKDSVALAQAAADAENIRLSTGKTTSFNVRQALRDLSLAQSREIATFVELNKALVQLEFVIGTLPSYLQIDVKIDQPKS